MKKFILALTFIAGFYAFAAVENVQAQSAQKAVEVALTFAKQGGYASNQFAVWVEDANGNFIKTIYATRFTALGGWKKRELSLPAWVKNSGLSTKPKDVSVDAITAPTPGSGVLRYSWDGKDGTGKNLPAGDYKIFVEASLRNENRAVYIADIKLGGVKSGAQTEVKPQPKYFGENKEERGMISAVSVKY